MALRLKFSRILATRYKTAMGEIDIVAAYSNVVVAIEIKMHAWRDDAIGQFGRADFVTFLRNST